LAQLKTAGPTFYYVLEAYERKKYIVEEKAFIKVS
jgi:hypothetical protein